MKFKTLLICLLLVSLMGCEGPAEKAGADLDSQVTAARQEVADLKQQIEGYKQTIDKTRQELATSKEQLALAQKELAETKLSRQEILQQMESVQKQMQAENTDTNQLNPDTQPKAQQKSTTPPSNRPAKSDKTGQSDTENLKTTPASTLPTGA